jgi:hypothetical protein
MSFDDDLDAQVAAEAEYADVDVLINGKLCTLRFFQMDGLDWADQTDRFPARPGVLLDMKYGYNIRPLSLAVAPLCGKMVDGDTLVDLTKEQWVKLFKGIAPASVMRIGDNIFNLNEYAPGEAVAAAKKASAAESALNSASPENTESPEVDSSDESLESSPPTDTTTPES